MTTFFAMNAMVRSSSRTMCDLRRGSVFLLRASLRSNTNFVSIRLFVFSMSLPEEEKKSVGTHVINVLIESLGLTVDSVGGAVAEDQEGGRGEGEEKQVR